MDDIVPRAAFGFSMPKFQMFDESGDPFDHLMHFRQVMTLQCKNDLLLCKVFPSSLAGLLSPGSTGCLSGSWPLSKNYRSPSLPNIYAP